MKIWSEEGKTEEGNEYLALFMDVDGNQANIAHVISKDISRIDEIENLKLSIEILYETALGKITLKEKLQHKIKKCHEEIKSMEEMLKTMYLPE
jgi:hypothetical protein